MTEERKNFTQLLRDNVGKECVIAAIVGDTVNAQEVTLVAVHADYITVADSGYHSHTLMKHIHSISFKVED